jgi:hypothetical protein
MKYIPDNACLGRMPFSEFLGLTSEFIPNKNRLEMFPTVKRECDEAAKECPTALWNLLSSEKLMPLLSKGEASRIVTLKFHGDTANVYVHDADTLQEIGWLFTGLAQRIFEKWHQENEKNPEAGTTEKQMTP